MEKNLTKKQVTKFTKLYLAQIAILGNHDFYSGTDVTQTDIENVFKELNILGKKLIGKDESPVEMQELIDYVRRQF